MVALVATATISQSTVAVTKGMGHCCPCSTCPCPAVSTVTTCFEQAFYNVIDISMWIIYLQFLLQQLE